MWNLQHVIFILRQRYWQIFKSALVTFKLHFKETLGLRLGLVHIWFIKRSSEVMQTNVFIRESLTLNLWKKNPTFLVFFLTYFFSIFFFFFLIWAPDSWRHIADTTKKPNLNMLQHLRFQCNFLHSDLKKFSSTQQNILF